MLTVDKGLPVQQGFVMPGEDYPQSDVLLAWPYRTDNWRENAAPVHAEFVELVKVIQAETPVTVCTPPACYEHAKQLLPADVQLLAIDSDDSWMRDIGPTYVINDAGERRGIDWQFNSWGGEYDGLYTPYDKDAAMAAAVLQQRNEVCYQAPLVLEGGSIHVDGEGTLYTTEECLLSPGRNPHLSKDEITQLLSDYLAIDKIIWLKRGLYQDETNGHIDNILHVIKPGEVVLSWCDDAQDPMYEICREGLVILAASQDAKGRSIVVHKLPIPGPLFLTEAEVAGLVPSSHNPRIAGERLAGSYANFLITNNLVVVPQFGCDTDQQALTILQTLFPAHKVVGVTTREILLGGGNIHCFTQQIPSNKYL